MAQKLSDNQIALIKKIGVEFVADTELTMGESETLETLKTSKLVRIRARSGTSGTTYYELGKKGFAMYWEWTHPVEVIEEPAIDPDYIGVIVMDDFKEGSPIPARQIEQPAIVEAEIEAPRACSCGQLLSADETKCAICIYWNAQGLKRPATKLVMGRDGIMLGILQDGEAEALEIKLPPFNPGPLKFISDETDQEIIERLKREIAQLMDEKAALEKQIKQVKTYQRREEDFEDWKTDKPYEDRGEEGKGIFF